MEDIYVYKYNFEQCKALGEEILPYSLFVEYVDKLKMYDDMDKCFKKQLDRLKSDFWSISFFDFAYDIVKLVGQCLRDRNEWFSYWVYELEFGERDASMTIEGKYVPHRTVEEIYTMLVNEFFISFEEGAESADENTVDYFELMKKIFDGMEEGKKNG